jgi:hypothetical protein
VDHALQLKYRSLVTIAALVVLGREGQLRAHVLGGVRAGLSREEILAAVVHLAFHAGLPAAYALPRGRPQRVCGSWAKEGEVPVTGLLLLHVDHVDDAALEFARELPQRRRSWRGAGGY